MLACFQVHSQPSSLALVLASTKPQNGSHDTISPGAISRLPESVFAWCRPGVLVMQGPSLLATTTMNPFILLHTGVGFSKAAGADDGFGILTAASVAPVIAVLLANLFKKWVCVVWWVRIDTELVLFGIQKTIADVLSFSLVLTVRLGLNPDENCGLACSKYVAKFVFNGLPELLQLHAKAVQ